MKKSRVRSLSNSPKAIQCKWQSWNSKSEAWTPGFGGLNHHPTPPPCEYHNFLSRSGKVWLKKVHQNEIHSHFLLLQSKILKSVNDLWRVILLLTHCLRHEVTLKCQLLIYSRDGQSPDPAIPSFPPVSIDESQAGLCMSVLCGAVSWYNDRVEKLC